MATQGDKIRAGKMLSKFLTEIATEETEVIQDPNCGDRMASKAEALARNIWRDALGYTETTVEDVDGKKVTHERKIRPDRSCVQLIWDRLEGKVGTDDDMKGHGLSLAERVGEVSKKRIASAGGLDEPSYTNPEADTT
jgi:hypothetical protein